MSQIQVVIFVFLWIFAAQAAEHNIQNPEELQYMHCMSSQKKASKLTKHYVVDIRNLDHPQLYLAIDIQKAKTTELKNLSLIDENLEIGENADVDVNWVSKNNKLVFLLNIMDNGGQLLKGKLVQGKTVTFVSCLDASLE